MQPGSKYIDIHDNEVVNLNIDKATVEMSDGRCQMEDVEEGNENDDENEKVELSADEPNYFAPTNSLQLLLKQPWFNDVRGDEKYDTSWTDAFVEALMGSEYGEGIARDWAVQGLREKKAQVRGYVIGLLKDAGVLKGSYRAIAAKVGIVVNEENKKDPYRTFADYMGRGKKQPYAQWVKGYVGA